MVGCTLIIEGMSVTLRPVLWNGIDMEVEGPSWSEAVCHSIIALSLLSLQAISTLCVTGKTSSSLMWYPCCRLILMTLQQDNATSHTARSMRDFLQDRNVRVGQPWPAKSSDLNPIEHVWDVLDWREISGNLQGALWEEWGNISQQELANLVQSMRRRCTAVLNAAGGHTR